MKQAVNETTCYIVVYFGIKWLQYVHKVQATIIKVTDREAAFPFRNVLSEFVHPDCMLLYFIACYFLPEDIHEQNKNELLKGKEVNLVYESFFPLQHYEFFKRKEKWRQIEHK